MGAMNRASSEKMDKSSSRLNDYRVYMEKQKQMLMGTGPSLNIKTAVRESIPVQIAP